MKPEPAEGETLDRLGGVWRVFQRRRGHRYATDDVLIAWTGQRTRPTARRILDLGAGVGSVGLLALLRLPDDTRLTSVEVQSISVDLLRKTIAYNGLKTRVDLRPGDLRDQDLLEGQPPYDLILANPPYLPPGRAKPSPDPQRASARLELHGDVFDYCAAAARHLADDGRFCFCHAAADPRPPRAVAAAGLALLTRQEVIFRHGRPPMIALFVCGRDSDGPTRELPVIAVRGPGGERTEAYAAVRRAMLIED